MRTLSLFIVSMVITCSIGTAHNHQFVLWNIGQGHFSTLVTKNECLHIDMGGRNPDIQKLKDLCFKRKNFLLLTHPDRDHLNLIPWLKYLLPGLCRLGDKYSLKKAKLYNQLKECGAQSINYQRLYKPIFKTRNDSAVFIVANRILITGDNPKKIERHWLSYKAQKSLQSIVYLVLGHHGSRTSTSKKLLQTLPQLRQALVSAKKSKYGHPHEEVIRALKYKRTPVLTTESFGSIFINLD